MGNWSELPRDLLRSITSFLPIADIHRFSSVCREWNFVSKEITHPPAAQLPWLVLTDHEITKKRMFYNMSEKKYYQFDIPELHGARCHGSSFGWLFVVGPRLETHLINPFSGAKHSLPRAPPYNFKREYYDDYLIEYGYKYPCILEPCIFSYELMQRIIVHKAILSADPNKCTDFVLMIMLNGDHKLAIWRVGDKDWTVFKENRYILEITCFKGQFFALLVGNKFATVDVGPEPKLIKHKQCLRECTSGAARYFINVSDISLLLVVRRTKKDENDDEHFTTSEFRVFELDLEEVEAYEIEDINGDTLFLGKNSGINVPFREFSGCRENCIYFSSDACDGLPEEKYGYDDMGVWSIVDETIKPLFEPNVYMSPTSCPIWLVPNPW
ncbi:ubiquitin-protein ligase [Carex littledalei]|uniref:Ubiquitin-protein ligase n=1 Tax=Carex littledalei TaxID=544730 RepID=A0A833VLP7_9POAL|nr:ubiquitin-protein ligase [Carex littledalei]